LRLLNAYFFRRYQLPLQSILFKQSLYFFVIAKCLYWLWHYNPLFGSTSIIYRASGHTNFLKDLAYVLYNNKSDLLPLYFIVAAILLCCIMLWRKKNNTGIDLALWLIVENLHYSIYATLTGGDYLLNQFLFFSIFIAINPADTRGKFRDLYLCLHNAAIVAVVLQVCLVYLVSGISKLMDQDWLAGTAVSLVNLTDHFSTGATRDSSWTGLHRVANYVVMLYQASFPFVVWVKKIKVPFLVIGIVMHLYIAFVMGLLAFGVLMVLSYIYFWPRRHVTVQI
jgi:hypothetical protein